MDEARLHTFLFADLAGFTALTEAHGDEHAADLVAEFCSRVRALLPEHDAEEVKAIGDALMLRTGDATAGVPPRGTPYARRSGCSTTARPVPLTGTQKDPRAHT